MIVVLCYYDPPKHDRMDNLESELFESVYPPSHHLLSIDLLKLIKGH